MRSAYCHLFRANRNYLKHYKMRTLKGVKTINAFDTIPTGTGAIISDNTGIYYHPIGAPDELHRSTLVSIPAAELYADWPNRKVVSLRSDRRGLLLVDMETGAVTQHREDTSIRSLLSSADGHGYFIANGKLCRLDPRKAEVCATFTVEQRAKGTFGAASSRSALSAAVTDNIAAVSMSDDSLCLFDLRKSGVLTSLPMPEPFSRTAFSGNTLFMRRQAIWHNRLSPTPAHVRGRRRDPRHHHGRQRRRPRRPIPTLAASSDSIPRPAAPSIARRSPGPG
ncbi:hypothetical protein J8273_3497 [Carpediemonas membranifera]|uniref:Uncharacterized protein n=1 Tax=Carpediemonas membranifera TaxID=201153 RepID=A0A8J6ASI3_9EUKA|nr:hypothetical protein J8273_3497 [Carpediemonas membranifera]|eukprot:KAG9393361.1 hypothetical protein J8273_3497 [Carpediemonas membranifera]